jgi:carbonic anhydrase/acetyltransferase-like protein (isoleucine patch superfamily)
MPIKIAKQKKIKDNSVLHGTYALHPCEVGELLTIGHSLIHQGCKIGNRCLIGMGSVVMDGAVIGEKCVVGAGSLVTEGKTFPPGSLIVGRPAVVKRPLNQQELNFLEQSADNYLLYKTWYK